MKGTTGFLSSICLLLFSSDISVAQQPKLMLPIGHRLEVVSAQFSPDGKKIVTASFDKTAKIWDVATGNLLADLKDHKDLVSAAEFSPDGKKILTASWDNTVKVWDAATKERLFTLKGHKDSIFTAHFSPDGNKIVTASADGTAKLWDVLTRRLIADLKGHRARVNTAMFSVDGKKVVTASSDKTAIIWDSETGKLIYTLNERGHEGPVNSAQFSPDGKKIVTASSDKTAIIWDALSGKYSFTLKGHKRGVNSAQFSLDGKKVVTTSSDSTAIIWDIIEKSTPVYLTGHKGSVRYAIFNRDGKKVVTASSDGTAIIWNTVTGKPESKLTGHTKRVVSIAFNRDYNQLVTASHDGSAKIWDAASGKLMLDLKGHTEWVYAARFSPDGKKIITATDNSSAKIWDTETGSLVTNLKGHIAAVNFVSFSRDGKKIVTISKDSTAKIWDAGTGNLDLNLHVKNNRYHFLFADFSLNGEKIALVTNKDTVKILNAITGDPVSASIIHVGVLSVQFNPDGKKIITASADSTAKIWDVNSGKLLATLIGHTDRLMYAEFSPDNTKVVTASEDRTARIWDASTGYKSDTVLIGHTGTVIEARFSKDGKKIVTSSEDKTAKIWEVKSGKLLSTLKGHTDWINSAEFNPNGKRIITASGDNTIKIWDAEKAKLLYTFFAVDSTDYLVVDTSNHFDGSENARNLLYFTCGTELVSLEQVKDELWVPNLATRLNNGEKINNKTLDELDICGLIPEIEITNNDYATQIDFKIVPRRGGIGETVLLVNGIEAKRYKKEDLKNDNGQYGLVVKRDSIINYLMTGLDNLVAVKACTANNDISSLETKIVLEKKDTFSATPNLYALMVGVSDYKEEDLDLNYAATDATEVSNTLTIAARKFLNKADGKEHVFIYNLTTAKNHDQLPEKKSIKLALEDIGKKATANDILFIFLSGHGMMRGEIKKQFYFLTADASPSSVNDDNAYAGVCISSAELTDWIKPQNIKAQKRILILDACHSGQAINDFVNQVANNQQANAVAKGESDEKAAMIKSIDKLNEASGSFILSASASNKVAFESPKYSHGYLALSLLKTIKEQPDILESDKYLNVTKWFNAAGKMVSELAKEEENEQKTQIFSVTDFSIGVVDSSVLASIKLPEEKLLFAASNFVSKDTTEDPDILGITKYINQSLTDISKGADRKIVYAPAANSANTYTLIGKYEFKDKEVKITVIIKRGSETLNRIEEKGAKDKLKELADTVVAKAVEWVNIKK